MALSFIPFICCIYQLDSVDFGPSVMLVAGVLLEVSVLDPVPCEGVVRGRDLRYLRSTFK
jgi:hypothetical protein